MSNLKEIKGRIASVQSTQKITSAMRMVSSAKLHRTQGITQNFLVYQQKLQDIMQSLGYGQQDDLGARSLDASGARSLDASGTRSLDASGTQSLDASMPRSLDASMPRGLVAKHVLIIPVAANSGLCGAFNSNILKATLQRKEEWEVKGTKVTLMPIGKKVNHSLRHEGLETKQDYVEMLDKMGKEDIFPKVVAMVDNIRKMQEKGDIDAVEFIYHHFKSMGSQKIMVDTLQTSYTELSPPAKKKDEHFITEPSASELIRIFIPRLVNAKVYGMMLDSVTSEHAARMLAMQTADDNAQDLTQELTLLYNKTRQQSITNELIDIMSGKAGN